VSPPPVRVAIVDDSPFIRSALTRLLEGDPDLLVVGAASTGEELLAKRAMWNPDVISLDLNMPGMGGLATLDRLMAESPLPVVILSTHSGEGAPLTLEALGRGAVDFIDKEAYSLVDFQALRRVLREKLVHVGRESLAAGQGEAPVVRTTAVARNRGFDAILIGASTGGPPAIETILRSLAPAPTVPVVIAQHMPSGFTRAFAERLNRLLPFEVCEAQGGERITAGRVWIAPGAHQLTIQGGADGPLLHLSEPEAGSLYLPSVNALFESAAAVIGARAIAVLLTGMGDDGSTGLGALRRRGAHTIAQDEASSVVFGMPRAAIAIGAAQEVLPLTEIGARLRTLSGTANAVASQASR
jgi:two-component system chemotaxis response regulator CheB